MPDGNEIIAEAPRSRSHDEGQPAVDQIVAFARHPVRAQGLLEKYVPVNRLYPTDPTEINEIGRLQNLECARLERVRVEDDTQAEFVGAYSPGFIQSSVLTVLAEAVTPESSRRVPATESPIARLSGRGSLRDCGHPERVSLRYGNRPEARQSTYCHARG